MVAHAVSYLAGMHSTNANQCSCLTLVYHVTPLVAIASTGHSGVTAVLDQYFNPKPLRLLQQTFCISDYMNTKLKLLRIHRRDNK